MRKFMCFSALTIAIVATATVGMAQDKSQGGADRYNALRPGATGQDRISKEVRHELVMLPYYGVFDNLAYRVNGSTVDLYGEVTRPTLKSDAENVVKHIEGVTQVNNHIEVLPLSPMDDQLRRAAFRTIYSEPALSQYGMQAVPPIHIIVNNGKITLVGVVATQTDKDLAGLRANSVPGAFSVTNNLVVEGGK